MIRERAIYQDCQPVDDGQVCCTVGVMMFLALNGALVGVHGYS